MTETVSLVGAIVLLAGALVAVVKQRRNGSREWDGAERRAGWAELRDDIKDIRRNVHGLRSDVQTVVTKVAVLEHRVGDLEGHR